ncbi:MAG TPA: hypothetical protein DHV05_02005 [Acholeplasmataceae bacterium]|nr:hypothetical protein [Acholeplasmataceae bacterium]
MAKIVLLPLDERPCNIRYPKQIFKQSSLEIVTPDSSVLGDKKTPASFDGLNQFLIDSTKDASGLVVSMDMLLYGGLVPSRLHHLSKEFLLERFNILRTIKEQNPSLIIYAFDLIMRCPQYSSNDEEPDYYGTCGLDIFKTGFIGHKIELGIATDEDKKSFERLNAPKHYLDDYLGRRDLNLSMNQMTLNYVKEGIIDFLIIPQDDAAQYGFTAKNQEVLKKEIDRLEINSKVYMYPGADEVANTLLSRMYTALEHKKPKFYIHYPSPSCATTIPLLEDRFLDVTVRYQIRAAGGMIISSIQEADIVLFVNASGTKMASSASMIAVRDEGLRTQRNLIDFVELMEDVISMGKVVAVADVATLNGSDHELMQLLKQKNLLLKLGAYAGWNTSSNTLGTTIPHGIQTWGNGFTKSHLDFLMARYVEDYGYMTTVKGSVNQELNAMGMNYFDVKSRLSDVEQMVEKRLQMFIHQYLAPIEKHIVIERVWMPWKRMFEVGVEVKYQD